MTTIKSTIRFAAVAAAIAGAAAIGFSAGHNATGTTDGGATVMLAGIAPCVEEDGSAPGQSFPCTWSASTQGNGLGVSFLLERPLGEEDPSTTVGAN